MCKRALITPHGDRKPGSTAELTDPSCGPHYPSWGSKTDDDRRRQNWCCRSSLPLMGIENVLAAEGLALRLQHLITPHGDRKHRTRSITASPCRNSLPLMGIENQASASAHGCKEWHLSLPLMGIENRLEPGRCRLLPALITPHGDRKHQAAGQVTPARPQLITPHGDRKLDEEPSGPRRRSVSLPLMGIENAPPRTDRSA